MVFSLSIGSASVVSTNVWKMGKTSPYHKINPHYYIGYWQNMIKLNNKLAVFFQFE